LLCRFLVSFLMSGCQILIAFWLQHNKYPPVLCKIHYSLLTVVLFVKLRPAQNTHNSIKNSRSMQISKRYKRSYLHGCSEDEHKMAIVTSFNAQTRLVFFWHGITG
jgi:hypothetical protein